MVSILHFNYYFKHKMSNRHFLREKTMESHINYTSGIHSQYFQVNKTFSLILTSTIRTRIFSTHTRTRIYTYVQYTHVHNLLRIRCSFNKMFTNYRQILRYIYTHTYKHILLSLFLFILIH